MTIAFGAIAGILFAIGLVIADMTSPPRVIGFLDIGGAWDPTLAFVMAAAIAVFAPVRALVRHRPRPLVAQRFHWPEPMRIDRPLVLGSAVFGIGWGLGGYCPGPAVVAMGAGNLDTLVFVACMVAGMAAGRLTSSAAGSRAARPADRS